MAHLDQNSVSYNAAISACQKAAQWQRVLGLLEAMLAEDIDPDLVGCSAAISACEQVGRWHQVLMLLAAAAVLAQFHVAAVSFNAAPTRARWSNPCGSGAREPWQS